MSEVAIILSDLYLAAEGRGGVDDRDAAVPKDALPALARFARFAGVNPLLGNWRGWLAAWLGRADVAAACNTTPAVIAAAAVPAATLPGDTGSVWLATPLHLVAGLSSVHLDYRGLLRVDDATLEALRADFDAAFAARGFSLPPAARRRTAGGGTGIRQSAAHGRSGAAAGRRHCRQHGAGPGAAPLLMLGAELEMWLHAHPLNAARARRREAPLTTLWLWGGGKPFSPQAAAPLIPATHPDSTFLTVFGEDPVAAGLCALSGARPRPPAASAHDILNSGAARTAAVIELFRTDQPQPATLLELLQHWTKWCSHR